MVDRKLLRENGKGNFLEYVWLGGKINGGAQIFSLWAHQKVFSPK